MPPCPFFRLRETLTEMFVLSFFSTFTVTPFIVAYERQYTVTLYTTILQDESAVTMDDSLWRGTSVNIPIPRTTFLFKVIPANNTWRKYKFWHVSSSLVGVKLWTSSNGGKCPFHWDTTFSDLVTFYIPVLVNSPWNVWVSTRDDLSITDWLLYTKYGSKRKMLSIELY